MLGISYHILNQINKIREYNVKKTHLFRTVVIITLTTY